MKFDTPQDRNTSVICEQIENGRSFDSQLRCMCNIVPTEVLEKLANDTSLTEEQRKIFANTSRVDLELRRLRIQASKLTRVAQKIAPAGLAAIAAAPAISVYDCNHNQTTPGAPVADPANSVDATAKHVFIETTSLAAFYLQVFGRNSIDGSGMALISSIHYGVQYNNAFWNGSQMTYGDGDGGIFVDFSRGNDVIGHELTHGVTQHSLQLNYTNEAGGLNESLSDCFGAMFRQWERKETASKADWLIGKDIMGPVAVSKGLTCLRDMADPAAKHCLSPQPTRYSQIKPGMDPHLSSGVPNLAFCTMAKAAGGNSWEKVGQVWYKAMTGYGPSPNMRMTAFANRTRAAAAALYPGDRAFAGIIDAGWKAVGL